MHEAHPRWGQPRPTGLVAHSALVFHIGCHEYGYYEGVAPKGCTVGKRCAACASPDAKYLKSEHFESYATGGCSGSCAPRGSKPAANAATAADNGGDDDEDDEEERRIWGSTAAKTSKDEYVPKVDL